MKIKNTNDYTDFSIHLTHFHFNNEKNLKTSNPNNKRKQIAKTQFNHEIVQIETYIKKKTLHTIKTVVRTQLKIPNPTQN